MTASDPLYVPPDPIEGQPHGAGMVSTSLVFLLPALFVAGVLALVLLVRRIRHD